MNITEKYQIEKTYCWKALKRIRTSLQRRVDFLYEKNDNFEELLTPLVGKNRFTVNERQLILDIYNHLHDSKVNQTHDQILVSIILKKLVKELGL